ncbi:GTP-binding protein [Candidatus Mycoplasma haematominutum]|uniref:Translation elongation factor LepA n=1 Tax=Candidatus Mycoplasma haematominutum 'Birmingham 1' TaxID=1116213 RepID=G8C2K5_9MOLU|nr:GTP-binding protein [Candidatus Mycoplasma haematominutum]CCE66553.1 translation elongation factor LepA [Candidatus Mycoplasma haematominutum 'Birmingham 1']
METRNFSIIAHIDHGKSTLSDRIIEACLGLPHASITNCFLDSMELEKEKGITIKLAAIRLTWKDYVLNLIDTPGHVDFSAEVVRSLKVSEAAILLIDVTKGIQSQTVSLLKQAKSEGLRLIPVLNKIDSPLATMERISEIQSRLSAFPYLLTDCHKISAREGKGILELLDSLTLKIPPHYQNRYLASLNIPFIKKREFYALVFEAEFHNQKGTILTVRVFTGEAAKGSEIYLVKSKLKVRIREIEFLTPHSQKSEKISAGDVGRIYLFLPKELKLESGEHLCSYPTPPRVELDLLPTSKIGELKPMIFSFIAPYDDTQRTLFTTSLASLSLSDSSFRYSFTQSSALGFGANIGALGPLHLEVLITRLEREFNLKLVNGPAMSEYKAILKSGEEVYFSATHQLPAQNLVREYLEPYILLNFSLDSQYEKEFISFLSFRRNAELLNIERGVDLELTYLIPLSELNSAFVHQLYSITKGYVTYNYAFEDYYPLSLVKVGIFINNIEYPELSFLSESSEAIKRGREILLKLKENVPSQLYELALQAKIGGKVIARENVKALRKAVAAKCYGGDISRKKKLWERQAEGKKKMKESSKLQLPHSFFKSLISTKS